ncbi:ZIP family metal transporter [Amantichitinum ursilacus]|uniref:Zinc transporter ZupT n=1 Tax=Amantichitinum ursilacus TaxID=857265 RepID=A0A0N0GR99_9NEIS|nr:ZIP family metal transporter [Amantichitinum ursilacus]KPC55458.1 Zinc transporter ZupT [Amantichitinum ursilacus]
MTTLILDFGQKLTQPAPPAWTRRHSLLAVIAAAVVAMFYFATAHSLRAGWIAGAGVALATSVGAVPVAFARKLPRWLADGLMLVGSGLMATVAVAWVIPDAYHSMSKLVGNTQEAAYAIGTVVLLGAMVFGRWQAGAEKIAQTNSGNREQLGLLMFALAITLHNLPEGLAAGISMASHGAGLTLGIGLQDVPEGFAVATALWRAGVSPARAAMGGVVSGLVEWAGALLGAAAISVSVSLLPVLTALAAGAMLWVIGKDALPRLRHGRPRDLAYFAVGVAVAVAVQW